MSQEARRNLIALLIAATVLEAVAAFLFRPAAVLGVKGGLDESVAGELDRRTVLVVDDFGRELAQRCAELSASNEYVCSIETIPAGAVGSGSATTTTRYHVDAGSFGCWEARKIVGPGPTTLEGCVGLLDY